MQPEDKIQDLINLLANPVSVSRSPGSSPGWEYCVVFLGKTLISDRTDSAFKMLASNYLWSVKNTPGHISLQ